MHKEKGQEIDSCKQTKNQFKTITFGNVIIF